MAAGGKRPRASARGSRARTRSYEELARRQVGDLQRARMLTAMVDEVCERGAAHVNVAQVVARSGVSRRTFYEMFSDCEDCVLAAFEQALARASERVLPAYEAPGSWRERIRAGLVALLSFLDEQPRLGRVLVYESAAGGRRVVERRSDVIASLTHAIDEGRGAGSGLPALTGEGVLGGALAVIQARLIQSDHAPLIELTNPLMSTIVLPYMGAVAARRELSRPAPKPAPPAASNGGVAGDPFKVAGMRLTYRTVRVLMAVAELSAPAEGPSNRAIGERAGVHDQGQISKLLHRLERAGLIENTGVQAGKGMPNAWNLTERGQRMIDGIRAHTKSGGAEGREPEEGHEPGEQ